MMGRFLFEEDFPLIKDEFFIFDNYTIKKSLRITSATKKLLQAVLLYNQVIILTTNSDITTIKQLAILVL